MCMARAIIMGWGAKNIKYEKDIISNTTYETIEERNFQEGCITPAYFANMRNNSRRKQTIMAELLCQKACVNPNIMATLEDIQHFEKVLNIQVLVVSASKGNRFIHTGTTNENKIYIYHVNDNHFHTINSISGFFRTRYFCHTCLQPYSNNNKHNCTSSCIVCKFQKCITNSESEQVCPDCNMNCRSQECFLRHKQIKNKTIISSCDRYKRCIQCTKVIDTNKRSVSDHVCSEWQYIIGIRRA